MKLPCEVIRDLLPLYTESLTSQQSNELVQEHLNDCSACRDVLQKMQVPEPAIQQDGQPLKRLKSAMREQLLEIVTWSIYGILLLISILSYSSIAPDGSYHLLYYVILFPLASLACSVAVGLQKGWFKWFVPLLLSLIAHLHPLLVNAIWEMDFDPMGFWWLLIMYFTPSLIVILLCAWHTRRKKS